MKDGGKKLNGSKRHDKAEGQQALGSAEKEIQAAAQYGLPDFSSAKMSRTSFLAA